MATYMQWNDALCEWFFRPDLAGQPVYLSCDPSVPTTVAQAQGWELADPLEDLLAAVRAGRGNTEPLDPWVRQASRWRGAGSRGNPPWVAILAVTVLAASGGGRDETGPVLHDRAYYRPLRQLLGLPAGPQPRAFDNDVCMLWTFLRQWLEDDLHGARGRPTARASKHLPNVGWALSQTVLSSAERARLPQFFQAIGARPAEDIAGGVLLACYLRWAVRHPGQGARLATEDRSSPAAQMLAGVLHQSLLSWDGGSRDERGRVTLPLLLAYYSARGVLQLASRVPPGLDHRLVQIDGQTVALGAPQECLLLPGDAAAALAGQAITGRVAPSDPRGSATDGPALTMKLALADVHVLAADAELGMWVEAGAASFGEEHVVVVRDHAAPAAEQAMTALGGGASRLTRVRLPGGWRAYQRFEPTRPAEVAGNLTPLLPSGAQLAQLTGGLPVSARSRVWLTGGPPDVVLPELQDCQERTVRLNGQELPWPRAGRLRLAEQALSAGAYEMAVAGRLLRFSLVDEAADQDGRGDVRLTVDRRPVRHTFTATVQGSSEAAPGGGPEDADPTGGAGRCGNCLRSVGGHGRRT